MADTKIKVPVVIVGTKAQIEAATIGENDFAIATDQEFYTKEDVDSLLGEVQQEVGKLTADVSAVEEDVVGKVAIAQGAENSGKILMVSDTGDVTVRDISSMPSNRFIDIALPAAGGSYYAPADGYVYVQKTSTSNSTTFQYLNLYNRPAANLCNTISTQTGGVVINAWVPAKKGDRIEFQYNLGGDTALCRFIYAQGAQ